MERLLTVLTSRYRLFFGYLKKYSFWGGEFCQFAVLVVRHVGLSRWRHVTVMKKGFILEKGIWFI